MKVFRLITTIAALALVTGCSVNPVTGKTQLSLVSPSEELAIGDSQYQPSQQSQGGLYTLDPQLSRYVANVGRKLAAVSQQPDLPYEFVVLDNDIPNAWALPGGKIAVNRGLLLELDDEAQLAAVIGHEIVHAVARHSASQMSQQMLLGIGSQFLSIAGQAAGYGDLLGSGGQLGSSLIMAQYGQDKELESDHYGMEYMSKAGYDPKAAVELQQTFVRLSQGHQSDWVTGLFASHPPSQARVEANRIKAAQLPPSNKRNRDAYQRAIAQIKRDAPAYKQHQEALKAASNKQLDQALTLVNKAIAMQPNEYLFWVTKGQLYMNNNEFQPATAAFTKAINLNPDYFMSRLGRGLSEKKTGQSKQAISDLQQSLDLLPTQIASFYLGELFEQQGDTQSAVRHYNNAAQAGGEMGTAAQQRIQVLANRR